MIAVGLIKLGEKARPPCAIKQRFDVRDRLDCRPSDEAPVVVADAPLPVRLGGEHYRRRDRAGARSSASTGAPPAATAASERPPSRAQAPCSGPAVCRVGPGGRPAQHVGLNLKCSECWVFGALEEQPRVGHAKGRSSVPSLSTFTPSTKRSGQGAPVRGRATADRGPQTVACFRGQQGRRDRRGADAGRDDLVETPARAEGVGPGSTAQGRPARSLRSDARSTTFARPCGVAWDTVPEHSWLLKLR